MRAEPLLGHPEARGARSACTRHPEGTRVPTRSCGRDPAHAWPCQRWRLPGALGEEAQGQEQQGGGEEQAREGEWLHRACVWGRGSFHPDALAALQGAMASARCPVFLTRGSGLPAAPSRMSPRSLKLNYKVSGVPSPLPPPPASP